MAREKNSRTGLMIGAVVLTFFLGLAFRFMPRRLSSVDKETSSTTSDVPTTSTTTTNEPTVGAPGSTPGRGTTAAPTSISPSTQGQVAAENEDELSEEETLAKTDPVWRKTWEHYKRMFILAQQMRQQPPAKPTMPHVRPPEPDPLPPDEDDDDPNPFRFPEE